MNVTLFEFKRISSRLESEFKTECRSVKVTDLLAYLLLIFFTFELSRCSSSLGNHSWYILYATAATDVAKANATHVLVFLFLAILNCF